MKKNERILKIARRVMESESKSISKAGKMFNKSFEEVVECILKSKGNVVITGMDKSGDIAKK